MNLAENFNIPWYIYLVPIIALGWSFLGRSRVSRTSSKANYKSRYYALTKTELSFYKVLLPAINGDYVLATKMRIADILSPDIKGDKKAWRIAFNRISSKHVDFVLLNSQTLAFVAAIELDDPSHSQKRRKSRDELVDHAFKTAQVPLIRIKTQRSYDQLNLTNTIQVALAKGVDESKAGNF